MDVEYVTDDDTEDALVSWCARRRREIVPLRVLLPVAAALALFEFRVLCHRGDAASAAFLFAAMCQPAAVGIAVIAYNGERERPLRAPHADVAVRYATGGLKSPKRKPI